MANLSDILNSIPMKDLFKPKIRDSEFDALHTEAMSYGKVSLNQVAEDKFYCYIYFNTIEGVELKAHHSGYKPTREESLAATIELAKQIKNNTHLISWNQK